MKTCLHFSVNRNPFNPDLLTMMWFTSFSWWMGRILIRLTVTSWQYRLSERLSKKVYVCVMNAKNGPNINSVLIIHAVSCQIIIKDKYGFIHIKIVHCRYDSASVKDVHPFFTQRKNSLKSQSTSWKDYLTLCVTLSYSLRSNNL